MDDIHTALNLNSAEQRAFLKDHDFSAYSSRDIFHFLEKAMLNHQGDLFETCWAKNSALDNKTIWANLGSHERAYLIDQLKFDKDSEVQEKTQKFLTQNRSINDNYLKNSKQRHGFMRFLLGDPHGTTVSRPDFPPSYDSHVFNAKDNQKPFSFSDEKKERPPVDRRSSELKRLTTKRSSWRKI